MKIAIDISQTAHEKTGVARYMTNLTTSLCENSSNNNYTFFYSSLRKPINNNLKEIIQDSRNKLINYYIPPSILSFLWNDLHYPNIEYFVGKVDLIVTSDWTEPPSKKAKMTIIHDLVFYHYPNTVHKRIYKNMIKRLHLVSKESNLVIADSNNTKEDLINIYGIDKKQVSTIYPYIDTSFPESAEYLKLQKKFKIKLPYILSVGKMEPRKNLNRLIDAFSKIKNKNKYELLICGPQGWDMSLNAKENIRFLGEVSDSDLYGLYKNAICFVYPSLYEGFGYPVIEAMSFGCPVATSNTSSLKEISGNAALLFNPFSTSEIQESIETLMYNMKLRMVYSSKGKQQAKKFNKNSYLSSFNDAISKAYDNWNRWKRS